MNQLQTVETETAGRRALFDYAALDQETQVLVRLRAGEIKSLAKRVAADIVEIGGKLAEVKDYVGGNGKFNEWLSAELGWSERTAYNFIAVWQRFGAANFALENVATSALYLLAAPSTPAEAVEAARQIADSGEQVTHSVAKEVVRQAKARKPKQKELIEEPEEETAMEESEAVEVQTCRVCGCTETDCRRCVEKTGAPCYWVTPDLCSACVTEPVKVFVSQAELDEMDGLNSSAEIDQGRPVGVIHRDDGSFVITDSAFSSHGRRETSAIGWLVEPEREAGDIRQRNHPADLVDEAPGYAETYLGVRVNVGTPARPEWWVVVGPSYEFALAAPAEEKLAPIVAAAEEEPRRPLEQLVGTVKRFSGRIVGSTLVNQGFTFGQVTEALDRKLIEKRNSSYLWYVAPAPAAEAVDPSAICLCGCKAGDHTREDGEFAECTKCECEVFQRANEAEIAERRAFEKTLGIGEAPASPSPAKPAPVSAQKPATVKTPATSKRPAAWYKTRVEITITLMPGGDGATRKVMHSVRAGDGMPFVQLTMGEDDLVGALPMTTLGLFEKAYEAFAKTPAAKPAAKPAKKPTVKSKPAAKKSAAKTKAKGGNK